MEDDNLNEFKGISLICVAISIILKRLALYSLISCSIYRLAASGTCSSPMFPKCLSWPFRGATKNVPQVPRKTKHATRNTPDEQTHTKKKGGTTSRKQLINKEILFTSNVSFGIGAGWVSPALSCHPDSSASVVYPGTSKFPEDVNEGLSVLVSSVVSNATTTRQPSKSRKGPGVPGKPLGSGECWRVLESPEGREGSGERKGGGILEGSGRVKRRFWGTPFSLSPHEKPLVSWNLESERDRNDTWSCHSAQKLRWQLQSAR